MEINVNYIKRSLKYIIRITIITTWLIYMVFGEIFPNEDGVYEISTDNDLLEFSKGINHGTIDNRSKAILIEDIELNNLQIYDGKISHIRLDNEWEPIGTKERPFDGEFVNIGNLGEYNEETNKVERSDINAICYWSRTLCWWKCRT